jgi:hypothetical protein
LIRAGGIGNSPISASDVTLFPQPDSPTIHKVRPRLTENEIPSIRSAGAFGWKVSEKFSTSRSGVSVVGSICSLNRPSFPRRR